MMPSTCVCREETCEQAAVLHYTYNRFEDLKSRRDRCDCAPTEDDAKRCFILPFDRSVSQHSITQHCIALQSGCSATIAARFDCLVFGGLGISHASLGMVSPGMRSDDAAYTRLFLQHRWSAFSMTFFSLHEN